jgi:hypothetical protein
MIATTGGAGITVTVTVLDVVETLFVSVATAVKA